MNLAFFSIVSVSSMSSLGCLVFVRALGNSSLGLYWLKGRVIAIIHAKTSKLCERFSENYWQIFFVCFKLKYLSS